MSEASEDLQARLSALSGRFSRLAGQLAEAGHELQDTATLPPEMLVEDLDATLVAFDELRARLTVVTGAGDTLVTLPALQAAVQSLIDAEARRAAQELETRRQAEEDARRRAEEEARRRAEAEARRQAEEEARRQAEEEARRLAEAEAQRRAEEEARRQAEALQRAEEEARHRAEAEARRHAEAEAQRKAEEEARRQAEAEAQRRAEERRQAEEEAKRKAEEEAKRKAAEEAKRKTEEEAKRKAEGEARRQADDTARTTPEGDARRKVAASDLKQKVEEVAAQPAAEAEAMPDPASAAAQWWFTAAEAWEALRARGTSFADAVRGELGKFPYLFSVPIQEGAQYENGQLPTGHAVLLLHVERRSSGFVGKARERIAGAGTTPLGTRLYQYLTRDGHLAETYPDLVREIMVAAIPTPGVWVDAGLSETEAATARFERSSTKIGNPDLRPHRVPDEQRFGEHHFPFTVAPLTVRFVRVNASELREPRSVEIKLQAAGASSDQAWILPVRKGAMAGAQGPLLRHSRAGTPVTGLGQEWSAVWIAVFNPDAEATRAYELIVTLRRGAVSKPSAFARPAGKKH